jgi:hypothetical protein
LRTPIRPPPLSVVHEIGTSNEAGRVALAIGNPKSMLARTSLRAGSARCQFSWANRQPALIILAPVNRCAFCRSRDPQMPTGGPGVLTSHSFNSTIMDSASG